MMKNIFRILVLVSLVGLSVGRAQEAPAPFQNGQTVVFAGDSITHGCMYSYYVQLFYATRFPDRKITFLNAGVNGDTAAGCLMRLDGDILAVKPDQVYMMFGMNDVGRNNYKTATPDDNTLAARAASLAAYRKALIENVQRIKAASALPVFLTPSPHDQYSVSARTNALAVTGNDGLAKCAQIVRELAASEHCPVVDLHAPMTALMLKNAEWKLAGADRVHPDQKASLVMAYYILRAQGNLGPVAKLMVDYAAKQSLSVENCRVDGIEVKDGSLKFNYRANSLPFPILPATYSAAAEIVPWESLNQEIIQVKNLPKSNYSLRIGEAEVGRFSADEFAAGINIAGLPTPQQQKANALYKAVYKKYTADIPLRDLVWQEHAYLLPRLLAGKVNPADVKTADRFFDNLLTNSHAAWLGPVVTRYREQRGKREELLRQSQVAQKEIHQLQKTEPYLVEIVNVSSCARKWMFAREADVNAVAIWWNGGGEPGFSKRFIPEEKYDGVVGGAMGIKVSRKVEKASASVLQLGFIYKVDLKTGVKYKISFHAKCTVPGKIIVQAIMNGKPWGMLGKDSLATINITSDWKKYELEFISLYDFDENARVPCVFLGLLPLEAEFMIQNVTLEKSEDP